MMKWHDKVVVAFAATSRLDVYQIDRLNEYPEQFWNV